MEYRKIKNKGDVEFYENMKGEKFQKIGESDLFRVKEGKIAYKIINKIGSYHIKYEKNGIRGFSVWKGKECIKDNMWNYQKALDLAYKLQ